MDTTSIYTVIITIVTVLGSTGAFRFYEKKMAIKQKEEDYAKDDYRERIDKLEILLSISSEEKEKMRAQILKLTEEVSSLRVKVEFLEKENEQLLKKQK